MFSNHLANNLISKNKILICYTNKINILSLSLSPSLQTSVAVE